MKHFVAKFRKALWLALEHDLINTAKAAAYSGLLMLFPALVFLTTLAAIVRRNGVLALDGMPIKTALLEKGVQLAIDGLPPDFVRRALREDMEQSLERHDIGQTLFRAIGAPAAFSDCAAANPPEYRITCAPALSAAAASSGESPMSTTFAGSSRRRVRWSCKCSPLRAGRGGVVDGARLLVDDGILEGSDPLDLAAHEVPADHVPRRGVEAAHARRRARKHNVPRLQGEVARGVRDQLGNLPDHQLGAVIVAQLVVDAHAHQDVLRIVYL